MLTIGHSSSSGRLTGSLLLAAILAPACGGQVGNDATANGFAGIGGQNVGSGGQTGSDAAQVGLAGTGGLPTAFGGASAGSIVGGTDGSADPGLFQDAGICGIDPLSLPGLITSVNTADMVDCTIPISLPVFGGNINEAFFNCTTLRGPAATGDGWTIDTTNDPARLVFGATLCEQVKAQGHGPVYLYWIHTTIV